MRQKLGSAWSSAMLVALGIFFVMAYGTTGTPKPTGSALAPRAAVDARTIEQPAQASMVQIPSGRAALSSDRPFPIILFVGVFLVVMSLVVHVAAWRWAHY